MMAEDKQGRIPAICKHRRPEESELWELWFRHRVHTHANAYKHTTPQRHTDNNTAQTICHFQGANCHREHVCAWPHSFSCFCHFCGTSLLRIGIYNLDSLRGDFLPTLKKRADCVCSNYTALLQVHSFFVLHSDRIWVKQQRAFTESRRCEVIWSAKENSQLLKQ